MEPDNRQALRLEPGPTAINALRACRAICLLAEGHPPEQVARRVRVKPGTLIVWQADASFQHLLRCVMDARLVDEARAMLSALTPDAVEALHRALECTDNSVAIRAAKEVLDRAGVLHSKSQPDQESGEGRIVVEYVNPEGHAISTAPWAARNPGAPGALQGGELRSPLRQDRDGQDSAD